MFWGMGNHLGPFPEASDRPEGQEQAALAVGSQRVLLGVTQLLSIDLVLVSNIRIVCVLGSLNQNELRTHGVEIQAHQHGH